jgi:membrane protein
METPKEDDMTRSNKDRRGRDAGSPLAMPRRGWRDIALRTWNSLSADHVSVVAAGVAFYAMLAIVPTLVALMSVGGLVFDPVEIADEIEALVAALPRDAASLVEEQIERILTDEEAAGIALILSIAIALFSASRGVVTLIDGMNIAYDETEKRGFVVLTLTALALTVVLIAGGLIGFAITVIVPPVLDALWLGSDTQTAVSALRWPVLGALTIFGLSILYRYGPSRANARWRWITPGAVLATVLWLAGSFLFSVYVENFGSYGRTYGSLGAIVILLTWLWLSAFIVLVGAEVDSELEHQTERDSTTGPTRPMGQRGAVKADRTGPIP